MSGAVLRPRRGCLPALFILFVAVACQSSHRIDSPPLATSLFAVLAERGIPISLSVSGPDIDPSVLEALKREVEARLSGADFEVGQQGGATPLELRIEVSECSPGKRWLRIFPGFGAGHASLGYRASYLAPDGKVLAILRGMERYTGMQAELARQYPEFSRLADDETAGAILVKEAARQIVRLARGRVPRS